MAFLLSKKFARDAAEIAALNTGGASGSVSFNGNNTQKKDLRVEAIGMAQVRAGQVQTAREDAMASARRNAVEHAMGVTVVATGQVRNLTQTVQNLKISACL